MKRTVVGVVAALPLLAACSAPAAPAPPAVTVTATPTVTVTVTADPAPPAATIETGTFRVGVEIMPGTYRSDGGQACYWARLADASGQGVIANNISDGPSLVTIEPGDYAFNSTRCATWELLP